MTASEHDVVRTASGRWFCLRCERLLNDDELDSPCEPETEE